MFHGSELGGRRSKLARWVAALSPKLAAWGEGGGAFPAAHAAGCIEIAAPQLRGESTCRPDRRHGFIDVGNRR